MAKLDFGLLLAFRNPPTWKLGRYEEHINQASGGRFSYDTVWLTEHHFGDGWCLFTTTAAAIAAEPGQLE